MTLEKIRAAVKTVFAWGFVAIVALAIARAGYGDYADRAALAESYSAMAQLKTSLSELIMDQGGTSGVGRKLPPLTDAFRQQAKVDYATVTEDGVIVFRQARYHQVVVLVPSYAGGQVAWRCVAAPAKAAPQECRPA